MILERSIERVINGRPAPTVPPNELPTFNGEPIPNGFNEFRPFKPFKPFKPFPPLAGKGTTCGRPVRGLLTTVYNWVRQLPPQKHGFAYRQNRKVRLVMIMLVGIAKAYTHFDHMQYDA